MSFVPNPPTGIDFSQISDSSSMKRFFRSLPFQNDEINHLLEVSNTSGNEEPGYSPTFRSGRAHNGLINTIHPELVTLYDYFNFAMTSYGENDCLGHRVKDRTTGKFLDVYEFVKYKDVAVARDHFGSGLLALANQLALPVEKLILTIFSANSYEWFVADLMCHAYSITNTSLYDTLGPNSSSYILHITQSQVMMLSQDKVDSILSLIEENQLDFIKLLVIMDDEGVVELSDATKQYAAKLGVTLKSFAEVLKIGSDHPHEHILPKPETLYTISFTSGTVGNPKGVCLTHGMAVAGLASIFACIRLPDADRLQSLCILPLAHVYQRLISIFELVNGVAICLPSNPKDSRTVMGDIKVVKPTHLVGVPRIFNRIDAGLKAKLSTANFLLRWLMSWALAYKQNRLVYHKELITNHWLFDRLIINKIKAVLGLENLQLAVTGSAPILPDTIKYLRGVLNTVLVQGYGLTESFACIAISLGDEENPSTSGYITVSTEFKLRDLPEMEYTYNVNQSGELLLRGPQIFTSYYKDAEKTKEAVDKDGWFYTGDVAKLIDGKIIIIDRVKNFFKLSQGEYVSPEKIENTYQLANSHLIDQVFCYGDSLQSYLVGIVVGNSGNIKKLLDEANIEVSDINDLGARKLLVKKFNESIKSAGLYGFEKFKNVHFFLDDDFNVDNDLLTPTLKIRRFNAKKFFENEIKQMYDEGDITR